MSFIPEKVVRAVPVKKRKYSYNLIENIGTKASKILKEKYNMSLAKYVEDAIKDFVKKESVK